MLTDLSSRRSKMGDLHSLPTVYLLGRSLRLVIHPRVGLEICVRVIPTIPHYRAKTRGTDATTAPPKNTVFGTSSINNGNIDSDGVDENLQDTFVINLHSCEHI